VNLHVPFIELIVNDSLCFGETIEGNLREQMVFRLVLHASHQKERENIMERVVSACSDLMFKEIHINFTLEFMFIFMVSNENRCSKETRNQLGHQKYPEILIENEKPVNHKENSFIFEDRGNE